MNMRKRLHRIGDNGEHLKIRTLPVFPIPKLYKTDTGVLPRSGKAEARRSENSIDRILLIHQKIMLHFLEDRNGAVLSRPYRQLNHCVEHSLIFIRQIRCGHPPEENAHSHHDEQIHRHATQRFVHHTGHDRLITGAGPIENPVEAAEKSGKQPFFVPLMFFGHRL